MPPNPILIVKAPIVAHMNSDSHNNSIAMAKIPTTTRPRSPKWRSAQIRNSNNPKGSLVPIY